MTIHLRQFAFALNVTDFEDRSDGRTVYGRIVPYGETIDFVDAYDGNAVKRERFERGALRGQANGAWGRVTLAFEHEPGFGNTIGYGKKMEERSDGAYASFRLYEPDADRARAMISESHRGLSLEFEEVTTRIESGIHVRQQVYVRRVGIVPDPAYMGAQVLAMRHATVSTPESAASIGEAQREATPHLDALRAFLEGVRGPGQ